MQLVITVSDEDGSTILNWAASQDRFGKDHRIFITTALRMWNVETVTGKDNSE